MQPFQTSGNDRDGVVVPAARHAAWVERLLWVFMLSFAFDYLAGEARQGGSGAGIDQLLFLGFCGASTAGILALGWRHLAVRPGAWLLLLWGGFVGYLLVNSLAQHVLPGRSLRIMLPFVFLLFGMSNAHIAACMGIPASRIVLPVFVTACINVPWRLFQGLYIQGLDIETVRFEIQSPATTWLATIIPCGLLLRGKQHGSVLLAGVILFAGIFICVTRSLLFPIAAAWLAAGICLLLCLKWGVCTWRAAVLRLAPVAAAGLFMLLVVGVAAFALPNVAGRWTDRLFHNADARNLASDVSYLTRRAEADWIFKNLKRDPVHFINGRGIGASYNWDLAYMPEVNLVIPPVNGEPLGTDMWFAGHSTWTYALYSSGGIGLILTVAFFVTAMVRSLIAAKLNAPHMGPDGWLAFLPFVVFFSFFSETLTSNPIHERLSGMIFGMMAGMIQVFFVRASWIHWSERNQTGEG